MVNRIRIDLQKSLEENGMVDSYPYDTPPSPPSAPYVGDIHDLSSIQERRDFVQQRVSTNATPRVPVAPDPFVEDLRRTAKERIQTLPRTIVAADKDAMDIGAVAEWFASMSVRGSRGVFREVVEMEGWNKEGWPTPMQLAEFMADWAHKRMQRSVVEPDESSEPV